MVLYFITSNKNKFKEAKAILGEVKQLDIELPEIQHHDPREIVRYKLQEAMKHANGEFIVDDTSLEFEALKGLPGPFIKWFLKRMGREGLAELCEKLGNNRAVARCVVGYAKSQVEIHFFEGVVNGRIVSPRGESNFGWDPIFQPDGFKKSYAEMSPEEKNAISHRRLALNKLKEFLVQKNK